MLCVYSVETYRLVSGRWRTTLRSMWDLWAKFIKRTYSGAATGERDRKCKFHVNRKYKHTCKRLVNSIVNDDGTSIVTEEEIDIKLVNCRN